MAGIKREKGIDVSLALTSKIKYTKKTKKAKNVKSEATPKSGKHGAKAQAIRDTLGHFGRKAPGEVIPDLKGQGIVASYSQVHTIRKTLFKRGRKPGSKAASPAAAVALDSISMEHLIEAKKLAEGWWYRSSMGRLFGTLQVAIEPVLLRVRRFCRILN